MRTMSTCLLVADATASAAFAEMAATTKPAPSRICCALRATKYSSSTMRMRAGRMAEILLFEAIRRSL
jgi:hypothetical protein